jgi:hypothetical protein
VNKRLFVKLTAIERDQLNALARILQVSRSEVIRALVLHAGHMEAARCIALANNGQGDVEHAARIQQMAEAARQRREVRVGRNGRC